MFDHCLYFNTAALARQLEREWCEAFSLFDLTPPQAFMLRAVLDQPGQSHSELAQAMFIAKPTVTRALDGLAAKAMIERRPSGHDGRETCIYPTTDAKAIHTALNRASGNVTQRLKRLLGEEVFVETVQRVREVRAAFD